MANVNVLFVCTGNTCRSPMAEGLFRKAAKGKGYVVSSAGVAAYDGSPASHETIEILEEKEAVLDNFGSRMVSEEILAAASHVFCLTHSHRDILQQHFPEMGDKFCLVTDFTEIEDQVGRDISDPIGCGKRAYEDVAQQLEVAIGGILGFLEAKKLS